MNSRPEKLISVPTGRSCTFFNKYSRVTTGILSIAMFGLQGLFVWKQKATTDASDTHNA